MITLQDFESLNENQRTAYLSKAGTFLGFTRTTNKLIVDLYSIADFYIEVFFDSLSEELLYIKPFSNLDRLAPYLEQVDISEVIAV